MTIKNPIFIIGSGSSGTTIFYNLLAMHPAVCWFSNISSLNPSMLFKLVILHRLLDFPFIGNKFKIRPDEGDRIYAYCGFKDKLRLTEKDYDKKKENKLKKIINFHLKTIGKGRFLNKQTANTQRIRLINKMFPDAYYVHIIRDGRAVANSLLNKKWWQDVDIWWLGTKPIQWEKRGKEPIELCALHWKRDVEEILQNKNLFKDRYIEIKYEDLVKDPINIMKNILNFCELSISEKFVEQLPKSLPSMNYKWRESLSKNQQALVNKITKDLRQEFGYID